MLREIFDLGGLLDGRGAADHGIQEVHHLRLAVLYFEDAHAQENSRHGSAGSGGRLLRFAIDKVAELRPPGERQEAKLRRRFPARGQRAFHVLLHGAGIVALSFISRSRPLTTKTLATPFVPPPPTPPPCTSPI